MTVQFLELETLTPVLIDKLESDIEKRIKWNRHQFHILSYKHIQEMSGTDRNLQFRLAGYSKVIDEYKQDLLNIHNFKTKQP